jgi:hypothetical protein
MPVIRHLKVIGLPCQTTTGGVLAGIVEAFRFPHPTMVYGGARHETINPHRGREYLYLGGNHPWKQRGS